MDQPLLEKLCCRDRKGPQSQVLMHELLLQAQAFGGGEHPQVIMSQSSVEPQKLKQGRERTEHRRCPLPVWRSIELISLSPDRYTVIHASFSFSAALSRGSLKRELSRCSQLRMSYSLSRAFDLLLIPSFPVLERRRVVASDPGRHSYSSARRTC